MHGRVLNASVARSSGSSILDRAALDTVASSTYAPETDACTAVAESYAVEVHFDD
jgi:TonB family protein